MRKMVMAVVARDQADRVLEELISSGYGATFTESRGGMLHQAQKMLFIAVDAERVDDVLRIIHDYCHTQVEVGSEIAELGSGVVFVWDLERFEAY